MPLSGHDAPQSEHRGAAGSKLIIPPGRHSIANTWHSTKIHTVMAGSKTAKGGGGTQVIIPCTYRAHETRESGVSDRLLTPMMLNDCCATCVLQFLEYSGHSNMIKKKNLQKYNMQYCGVVYSFPPNVLKRLSNTAKCAASHTLHHST